MIWRVVATQQGFHNQILREPGEVFDLLLYADGSYPPLQRELPKKDEKGAIIPDEYTYETVYIKGTKDPVHRDFAEDRGHIPIKHGPHRGDTMRFGWMKRVADTVPVGLYPEGTNFWNKTMLPPPQQRAGGAPPDPRRLHAPVLSVLAPEVTEAA